MTGVGLGAATADSRFVASAAMIVDDQGTEFIPFAEVASGGRR